MDNISELELEELLKGAATRPAQRPNFLDALLASNIYCLGFLSQSEGEGE